MKGSTPTMKDIKDRLKNAPKAPSKEVQSSQRTRTFSKVNSGKNIELLGPIILVILLMIISSLFIGLL